MKRKIYLPDFDRRDVPTLLDLASGQMLHLGGAGRGQPGRGDLGWDGVPVIFPGASLRRYKDGAWTSIQPWAEVRGMQGCWLPKHFPARVLLKTRSGAEYTIDLLQEHHGGVLLEYQSGALAAPRCRSLPVCWGERPNISGSCCI